MFGKIGCLFFSHFSYMVLISKPNGVRYWQVGGREQCLGAEKT